MSQERWEIRTCSECGSDWGIDNQYFPTICEACRGKGKVRMVEVVPARALEAALEEARQLRRLLNEGIELLDADTNSHGTYENWREATLGWQDEARSALVSGEQG